MDAEDASDDVEVPVDVDEMYVLDVESVDPDDGGLAYVDDFTVIVPDVEEGERVEVRIDEVNDERAVGEVVERDPDA